jgi:rod shape-determining protein MreB and related proteins
MWFRKIMADPDIAIDLGTANTRVCAFGVNQILEEPSAIDYKVRTNQNEEVGIRVLPLRGGVIADVDAATFLLKPKFERMKKFGLIKPRALACIPSDASEKERYSLMRAINNAGASSVHVVPEPLAAAVGAGIDISDKHATMLIDLGDGVTDIAVIRSGELIHTAAIRKACSDIHSAVRELLRVHYHMIITREDAEQISRDLSSKDSSITVTGKCTRRNWEMSAKINTDLLKFTLNTVLSLIFKRISNFIKTLPDDVSAEISESGIYLTGGGARLTGIGQRIQSETGIVTTCVNDPLRAVIHGASMMLDVGVATNVWNQ